MAEADSQKGEGSAPLGAQQRGLGSNFNDIVNRELEFKNKELEQKVALRTP